MKHVHEESGRIRTTPTPPRTPTATPQQSGILALQRAAGNAAVGALLNAQRCGPEPCDCGPEEREAREAAPSVHNVP